MKVLSETQQLYDEDEDEDEAVIAQQHGDVHEVHDEVLVQSVDYIMENVVFFLVELPQSDGLVMIDDQELTLMDEDEDEHEEDHSVFNLSTDV